jgi:hypothetical protein
MKPQNFIWGKEKILTSAEGCGTSSLTFPKWFSCNPGSETVKHIFKS